MLSHLINAQTNPIDVSKLINKIGEKYPEIAIHFINNLNEFFLVLVEQLGIHFSNGIIPISSISNTILPTIPAPASNINLNENQQKILDNLKILFPNASFNDLYEAIIVCNEDEDMAANYLFETINPL